MFNRKSLGVFILSFVLIVGLFAASGAAITYHARAAAVNQTAPTDQLFNGIYQQVSPSVVAINVILQQSANNSAFGQSGPVAASGSGFVIDKQGDIVTNNHVVDGATYIEVNFLDGTIVAGKVIGADPNSDLAVVKVDLPADQLQPVTFGDSSSLEIGQAVLAIGSPFNERWTLTSGIVSALDRTIQGLTQFSVGGVIQTDAAINPGNSGGPLLNMDGQVIGVNSQIESNAQSNAGVGFAIPSNLVKQVAQTLIDKGTIQYSYLGISGGDVNLSIIQGFNLKDNQRGVVVGDVTSGSPAAAAGLKSAGQPTSNDPTAPPSSVDIITAIDAHQLTGIGDLITYLANNTQPGQTVTLTVLRNGTDTLQLQVKLTARPASS
jgi:S1-C subfamily serine protease